MGFDGAYKAAQRANDVLDERVRKANEDKAAAAAKKAEEEKAAAKKAEEEKEAKKAKEDKKEDDK